MLTTMQFLEVVWGGRKSWVDVPSKIRGHWIPSIHRWPADQAVIHRRIVSCLEDGESVYFSAAQFKNKGRRIEDALPTQWLWADLDLEDPVFLEEDGLLPTLVWESSPGRYQAMWHLTRELEPALQTRLNRRLTYAIAADHGGYDLTQVLRPPGTLNFKYDPPSEVTLLWYLPDTKYHPREILHRVTLLEEDHAPPALHPPVSLAVLPARARRLLKTPPSMVVVGERSSRLWELECLLAQAGLEVDQIVDLVKPTAWNKWKDVNTGDRQLRADAAKAISHVQRDQTSEAPSPRSDTAQRDVDDRSGSVEGTHGKQRKASPFVDYATFLGSHIPTPRWLIEGIWSADSHGFIGGEPKVSKSTLAMAMAISVATGTPFLGKFNVPKAGPVLMVQEENAPWMVQDRLRKLANHAGVLRQESQVDSPKGSMIEHVIQVEFPPDAPLYLLNNYGFDLTDGDDRDMLEQEIIDKRAKLVILDPFYLILGMSNVSSQHEIGPLLQWLTAIRYTHNCAIAIVHHWSKYSENTTHRRPGQRLMGTGIQHGWVESGLYIESESFNTATGELKVKVEREFRNAPPSNPLSVVWKLGKPGELDLKVDAFEFNAAGKMVETLAGLGIGEGKVNLTAFAEAMELDKLVARQMIDAAEGYKIVSQKWGRGRAYYVVEEGTDAA